MFSKSTMMIHRAISLMTGASSRRLAFAMLTVCLGTTSAAVAVPYDFLTVASTGALTSQFTSPNGYGVINVSHVFSAGGQGPDDNNNPLIFPSQFTTLFPGTGQVQGHLAQTHYDHNSVVTFDLTAYALSPSTVFGMWNTTDEVAQPAYRVELIDSGNNPQFPTTFNLIGNQDNITPLGMHKLVLNTATGNITAGALLNPLGKHTDAAFWDNIPVGTKKIIVYGNLQPLNNLGDGVGYYFAEKVVPEPSTAVLLAVGIAGMSWIRKRRRKAH